MAYKIFLDANILLDFVLKREEHYHDARQIIELIINNRAQAVITSSVLHIAGYWITKAYGSTKAKELLLTLLVDVKVIDIPHEVALTALHSKIDDIEDALQYYTAIHHKVNYFISRDKQLQKDSIPVLPVYTPNEFLKERG
jgi:predicted nucleic acid-binding protein